jgi:hypothetical protein
MVDSGPRDVDERSGRRDDRPAAHGPEQNAADSRRGDNAHETARTHQVRSVAQRTASAALLRHDGRVNRRPAVARIHRFTFRYAITRRGGIETSNSRLVDAIAAGGDCGPLVARIKALEQERAQLDRELAGIEAEGHPVATMETMRKAVDRLFTEWRQAIMEGAKEPRSCS